MAAESYADALLDAPIIETTGETMAAENARPYLDTEAPTAEEAAELVRALMGAGTVERLDLLHDALRSAFRRGQAAERLESDRLATAAAERFAREARELVEAHAATFSAEHQDRARAQLEQDARPWWER